MQSAQLPHAPLQSFFLLCGLRKENDFKSLESHPKREVVFKKSVQQVTAVTVLGTGVQGVLANIFLRT